MTPNDRDEDQDSGPTNGHSDRPSPPDPLPEAVATSDHAIAAGRSGSRPEGVRPDETIVAQTTHVTDSKDFVSPISVGPSGSEKSKKPDRKDRAEDSDDGQDDKHREDRSRPSHSNHPAWLGYVVTGVVALVCGVGGAWAYSHFASSKDQDQAKSGDQSKKGKDDASSKKGSSDSQAKGKDDDSSGGPASTSGNEAQAGGDDKLKEQVQGLAARFDVLRQRVEVMSMPRDTNSHDLGSLRIRVDDISQKVDDMKNLSTRSRDMEDQLNRLKDEVKGLRDQPVAERERGGPIASPPIIVEAMKSRLEMPPAPVPPVDPNAPDEALAAGMALFKKGKYPQAEAIFRNLQLTKPQDARVWYYSALANGLASGQWEGETRSFVMQGAERERAGLPAASIIDSAFADLSSASGKDWLASYRTRLMKR